MLISCVGMVIIHPTMAVRSSSFLLFSSLIAGRLFTVFYAPFGLAFIFSTMNSFATSIIKSAEESALERIHTNPEQNRVGYLMRDNDD